MRALRNQQRVQAPNSDFPFARIKDTTASERGTPINENVTGDQFQFFEKLMAVAEIEPNELPDCEYTGFQLFQSFLKVSNKYNAAPIIKSMIGSYAENDLIVLFGVEITLSNSDNTAIWTEGAVFYNDQVYLVPAGSDTKVGGVFLYSIDDEDDYLVTITNGDSGDGIADYGDPSVKYLSTEEFTATNTFPNTFITAVTVPGGCTGGIASAQGIADYGVRFLKRGNRMNVSGILFIDVPNSTADDNFESGSSFPIGFIKLSLATKYKGVIGNNSSRTYGIANLTAHASAGTGTNAFGSLSYVAAVKINSDGDIQIDTIGRPGANTRIHVAFSMDYILNEF